MLNYLSKSEDETIALGKKLSRQLSPGDKIFLYGSLGAGKTRFIKGIGEGLGAAEEIRSPTYIFRSSCLLDETQDSDRGELIHYDLYRFGKKNNMLAMGLEEDFDDYRDIVAVEWADRLGKCRMINDECRMINVYLKHKGKNKRRIRIDLKNKRVPSKKEIKDILNEAGTPSHVRGHSRAVACVAVEYAKKLTAKGEIINIPLVYAACLLHDLARHFKNFKEKEHAEKAALILREKEYLDLAEIVCMHCFNAVRKKKEFNSWEKKIVYYADKRVVHDKKVSLDERFREGLKRWHKGKEPKDFKTLKKKTKEIEKEILGICSN